MLKRFELRCDECGQEWVWEGPSTHTHAFFYDWDCIHCGNKAPMCIDHAGDIELLEGEVVLTNEECNAATG